VKDISKEDVMSHGRVVAVNGELTQAMRDELVGVLDGGGLVALPTDTIYGLSCRMDRPDAVARLHTVKGRDAARGFILLVHDPAQVSSLAREIPPSAAHLMESYWPGPLTLLFEAASSVPQEVRSEEGTVAIRYPSHSLLATVLRAVDVPLTSTSANRSGAMPLNSAQAIADEFSDVLDLIVDAGPPTTDLPSTIVDVSTHPPRLVRVGALVLDALKLDV
jgi:L-threonylcarbamoyladenylate synthase